MFRIDDQLVEKFQRDGVVLLRGVFAEWVKPLAESVEAALADPSPRERSYQSDDGSAPFFQDYCNFERFPGLRAFVHESPAGMVAAQLMRSRTARFFHDHILVKRPGTSLVTPWHQDQPYYCVEGQQSVSFWTPLDPVARQVCMECVAGSHEWSKTDYEPQRFDGSALYEKNDFAELPDIDVDRAAFDLRGWDMRPGDAIAFNFRTIHGAPANQSAVGRRVVSTRWVGDDARWAVRGGPTSPPFPHIDLPDGAPFDAPEFPVVYRQN